MHDDVTSGRCSPPPSSERMQHVYPDVIIVERGRTGKADVSRVSLDDTCMTSRYTPAETGQTESMMKLCHIGDVTDDDVNASLKDYTYMYKKDAETSSTTQPTDYDACSDISSVSSSIVDYVRRSLTEVGVSTAYSESRDEQPPPLPAKTTTQRRAPLHCEIHAQQVADDVITSTWEPTHMTWDEVKSVRVTNFIETNILFNFARLFTAVVQLSTINMTLIEYSKLLFVIPNPLFIYSLAINTLLAFVQVRFF